MRIGSLALGLMAFLFATGCGEGGPDTVPGPNTPPPNSWQNRTPSVSMVAPSALIVGQSMSVLGNNFLSQDEGRVMLHFKGEYYEEGGGTTPVDAEFNTQVQSNRKLTWNMWPNVVFAKDRRSLGQFVGTVSAINLGKDGGEGLRSAPVNVSLVVKPSIIVSAFKPIGESCGSVVGGTHEDKPMHMVVEAVGLRPASPDNPITFTWTFLRSQWQLRYGYDNLDISTVDPETSPVQARHTLTSGTQSSLMDGGDGPHVTLQIGSEMFGTNDKEKLTKLKTIALPDEANSMPASVSVRAVDASGKSARVTIPFTIRREVALRYKENEHIAEIFTPTMVQACSFGGDIGTDVQYSEGTSQERSRSMSYNWNVNASVGFNPFAIFGGGGAAWFLQFTLSAGFGMNVEERVSSSQSTNFSLSGHILPGEAGAYYRQLIKKHHIGYLVGYTACGEAHELGEAILTNWVWAADLARGPTCPPQTNLPPAEKFRDDGAYVPKS